MIRRLAVLVPVTVAGLLAVGVPEASAHGTAVYMTGGHGGVTDSHQYAYVCDDRAGPVLWSVSPAAK